MQFRIKEARENAGFSQKELAGIIGVAANTFHGYETGKHDPKSDLLVKIASACHVTVDFLLGIESAKTSNSEAALSPQAQRIGRAYEKATPPVQRTVEVALEPYMDVPDNIICVDFFHSEQPTSAGIGTFLSDETMTTLRVRLDALPKGYERTTDRYFSVSVSGDSMEPRYQDGDILIVSREPVNVGEIGVFTMDGEGYVKQLGCGALVSLNKAYDDIPLTEDVRCNGKVVGVLDPAAIAE